MTWALAPIREDIVQLMASNAQICQIAAIVESLISFFQWFLWPNADLELVNHMSTLSTIMATPILKWIFILLVKSGHHSCKEYIHFTPSCGHPHVKESSMLPDTVATSFSKSVSMILDTVATLSQRMCLGFFWRVATLFKKRFTKVPATPLEISILLELRLPSSKRTCLNGGHSITQGQAADISSFTVKGVLASWFLLV